MNRRNVVKLELPVEIIGDTAKLKWRLRMEANKKGVPLDAELAYFTYMRGTRMATVQVYTTGAKVK